MIYFTVWVAVTDPELVISYLKMAAALDPDEVLRSSKGRDNFQHLARLLISGGTVLLREVFDIKCPPSKLRAILQNPATKKGYIRKQSSPNHSGTVCTLRQGCTESQQTLI